jgi:NADPH2:quinone reductase
MSKSIRIHETGGPEVMKFEDVEIGDPGPGQVKLRHRAIGLNFIDVYFRNGLYKQPLPFTPGNEGAGDVIAVGEGVTDFKTGDRVAYCSAIGSYCEERLINTGILVRLPDTVSYETGAAMMLKGLTAQYLLRQTYKVQPGDTILMHAAAGGVGQILCQWAKALGATVIGTVGSRDKIALAKDAGCDFVIDYAKEDFVARVGEITGGEKCAVVYDGVGQATFPASLDCLRPLGMFVSFGSASGPIKAFDINLLTQKGSLFCTRPTLFTYASDRERLDTMASDLFEVLASGKVSIPINQTFALKDAVAAHKALEGRQTTGTTILVP